MGTIGITIKVTASDAQGYDDLQYTGDLPSPLIWAGPPVSSCGGTVTVDEGNLAFDKGEIPVGGYSPDDPKFCALTGTVKWNAKSCAPANVTYTITRLEFTNNGMEIFWPNVQDTLACKGGAAGAGAHSVPTLNFYGALALSLAVALAGLWVRGRRG